jgi:predicted ATP-dependent endonuclease of OLD family
MNISFINIRNFRKLKDVRVDLSNETTLFVGANNSGKTSAMDALRKFLVKGDGNSFIFYDFTVSNREAINRIGKDWIIPNTQKPNDLCAWVDIVPIMDVWLEVHSDEFHYVAHIIPTLEWAGGKLGVRLSYLPKDIGKLFDDYRTAYEQARTTEKNENNKGGVELPPKNLCEFIESNLSKYFEIKAFILDPKKANEFQSTDFGCECEVKNPFGNLIKIDMIDAQRGLADADSSNDVVSLTRQFKAYYNKHLDIDKATAPEDLDTLAALQTAHENFNETLAVKFKDALAELETLGYPGVSDPKITIESKFKENIAFEHDSAVQYALSGSETDIRLPEKYNGLGYQNLILIVFRLMSFRDDRIHKGKAKTEDDVDNIFPLHLVLLEEPEAHLHVQVQQVLIKKAYSILTNNAVLRGNNFNTQLVVSTHSSHIAKEIEFENIRYFKRIPANEECIIPTAEVISLTDTFGRDEKTTKFVQRYLRVTHCDLFFADAVIFVEGTSETVLVPYFIRNDFTELDSRYITVLPVGGSHSHRFKPLIEKLNIPTLVITDLDPIDSDKNRSSIAPQRRQKNIVSGNSSIREWGIVQTNLDELLDLDGDSKIFFNNALRIAYQIPVIIDFHDTKSEVIAATFEDSLVYANFKVLQNTDIDSNSIIKKVREAAGKSTVNEFCNNIYSYIHGDSGGKVSFALELIYQLVKVEVPEYIREGLEWLQAKLRRSDAELSTGGTANA